MSVVTVQLGQCGNQIGEQFFSTVSEDLHTVQNVASYSSGSHDDFIQTATQRFFNSTEKGLQSRSVMVDMEEKVIAQSMSSVRKTQRWHYPENQQFCQKRGSGNNWAHGFCLHGPKAEERIMTMVRREAEKCDRLGGFLALLSLAGGTGSGVGAYVTQCLRDEYPQSFILNQVVAPYRMGEVVVQNYNAVLTLSNLYQTSDAIVTLDNDSLHQICSRLLSINPISFRDINKVICHKMASVLLPCFAGSSKQLIRNHVGDMLEHVAAQPEYKLLTILTIPHISEHAKQYSTFNWQSQLKNLRQMLIANATMEEGIDWGVTASQHSGHFNRSVANLLFLRGKEISLADAQPLCEPHLYTNWMPSAHASAAWQHPCAVAGYEKSCALLSNSQSVARGLDGIVARAWRMFGERAYLHHYARFGLSSDDFMDAFCRLEQVIASYKQL